MTVIGFLFAVRNHFRWIMEFVSFYW